MRGHVKGVGRELLARTCERLPGIPAGQRASCADSPRSPLSHCSRRLSQFAHATITGIAENTAAEKRRF
jgi:hypothetical protein